MSESSSSPISSRETGSQRLLRELRELLSEVGGSIHAVLTSRPLSALVAKRPEREHRDLAASGTMIPSLGHYISHQKSAQSLRLATHDRISGLHFTLWLCWKSGEEEWGRLGGSFEPEEPPLAPSDRRRHGVGMPSSRESIEH